MEIPNAKVRNVNKARKGNIHLDCGYFPTPRHVLFFFSTALTSIISEFRTLTCSSFFSFSVGTLAPCCSGNVFTFRICLAHESSQCPALWRNCQTHRFQIHESGEALQWAAFGQEEGDLRLVSKSQHVLCPHGDTAFSWPLQVMAKKNTESDL